jgi:hypothetical protein
MIAAEAGDPRSSELDAYLAQRQADSCRCHRFYVIFVGSRTVRANGASWSPLTSTATRRPLRRSQCAGELGGPSFEATIPRLACLSSRTPAWSP